MKSYISLIIFALLGFNVFSQHYQHPMDTTTVENKAMMHGVAILYGSILIPEYDNHGLQIGKALLPSISLDYEMWWHHKFGVLVMNEFVLNSYEVQTVDGEHFNRESILISTVALGFSPFSHFDVFAGSGFEIDLTNGKAFCVMRVGTEYALPLNHNWATVMALAGDFRQQYSSVSFEIGFAKFF
jgi:hypothetical protein